MAQIIGLGNSANWEGLPSVSRESQIIQAGTNTISLPIQPISIPIIIDSPIITVFVSSTTRKLTWNYAGYLAQKIRVGLTVGGGQDASLEKGRRISFERLTLFQFSDIAADYELIFFPAAWLTQVTFQAWIYTGIDSHTLDDTVYAMGRQVLRTAQDVESIRATIEGRNPFATLNPFGFELI